MMVTVKRILKAIGNENLTLYRVDEYHVFAYDNGGNVFETETILLPRLNDASIYWWVRSGKDFVKKCLDREAEIVENEAYLKERFRTL